MVKDDVLALLEKNRGRFVSGQTIADILSVSRNAVWKAVKALESKGYAIESVTNKGYRLSSDTDPISKQSILKYLQNTEFYSVDVRKSVTSTNDIIKQLAVAGETQGKVVIAESQTGGKGRRGRAFFSPQRSGVYMSILLRPMLAAADSLKITTAAAVAVAAAVDDVFGVHTKIKWVNDVYLNDKKICGILTEASLSVENGGLDYAVLGIGINVTEPEGGFPDEIKDIAGAICSSADSDRRSQLCAQVLDRFFWHYVNINSRDFLSEYRNRSLLDGKTVTVIKASENYPATVVGIDDDFRLIVDTNEGRQYLSTGEVSIKPR